MKNCSKCLGRGYWTVFKDLTVNGTNEQGKQQCDKCQGTGKEQKLYAKILIGINKDQTLFVSLYDPKTEVILVNAKGNNFNYGKGEYEKVNIGYKNGWE